MFDLRSKTSYFDVLRMWALVFFFFFLVLLEVCCSSYLLGSSVLVSLRFFSAYFCFPYLSSESFSKPVNYFMFWERKSQMEGCKRKEEDCPKLLDLITRNGEWVINGDAQKLHGFTEEKKLELSLAPPGEEHFKIKENTKINCSERDGSLLSVKCFSPLASNNNLLPSPQWSSSSSPGFQQSKQPGFLQFPPSTPAQNLSVMGESSQPCCNRAVRELHTADQNAFSPPPAKTAVTNSSQKRYLSFFFFLFSFLFFLLIGGRSDRAYSLTVTFSDVCGPFFLHMHNSSVNLLSVSNFVMMFSKFFLFISIFVSSDLFNYQLCFPVFLLKML